MPSLFHAIAVVILLCTPLSLRARQQSAATRNIIEESENNDSSHVGEEAVCASPNSPGEEGEWWQINDGAKNLQGDQAHDLFGWSVSLSKDGTTVAVGAIDNDANGSASGQVRVFQIPQHGNTTANDVDSLGSAINGLAAGDYNGYAVSLSANGTILALGAPNHKQSSGMVRVYRYQRDKDAWIQLGQSLVGDFPGDGLGHTLALSNSGRTLSVGAPYHNNNTGLVRVFQRHESSDSWRLCGQDLHGDVAGAQFGYSVSISEKADILAVGSKNHPYYTSSYSVGQVQVFRWGKPTENYETEKWIDLTNPIYGIKPGDYYGFAVSLSASGSTMAIGSPYFDTSNGKDAGRVQIYRLEPTLNGTSDSCSATVYRWVETGGGGSLVGGKAGDYFGYSVSLSSNGNRIAIGARQAMSLAGEVKTYDFTSELPLVDTHSSAFWMQKGGTIVGEKVQDQSGFSVSLSANGRCVAIGSPYHSRVITSQRPDQRGGENPPPVMEPNVGKVRVLFHLEKQSGPRTERSNICEAKSK